ncbi:MAG: dTDP-glucose 4,6-dehydratase [Chlamydiae bacterium]|nr:dTDP-glucose 4,6-dehydratase [Chlamydiota bacterium]
MIFDKAHLLVTGGAGFIGSAFICKTLCLPTFSGKIVNIDKLSYAANLDLLKGFDKHPRYQFIQADINQTELIERICLDSEIDAIVHFAAETHVDRSIQASSAFVDANILGTVSLLEVIRKYPSIHFHHVSTDEVYGSLGEGGLFSEHSPYRPNSPYSATKAASDHLVRAYGHTYNFSVTISNCSNNYGPGQHTEKFIPLMISRCLEKKFLPIYGRGANIRDWLYVDDHVEAIWAILRSGVKGETYNIGAASERTNLEIAHLLIEILAKRINESLDSYLSLIRFVADRPGHDFRYAIDSSKIREQLGWKPKWTLEKGLERTVKWYTEMNSKVGR